MAISTIGIAGTSGFGKVGQIVTDSFTGTESATTVAT